MDAFQAKTQVQLDDGSISKITKEQADAFNALNTLDDRLKAMRAQPEIGRQFMSTVEMSEGQVAIRQLVLGGKAVEELEAKSRGLITGLAGGQVEFENLSTVIGENTKLTQAANQAEAGREVGRIRNTDAAIEGQILDEFSKTIAGVNLSGLDFVGEALANRGVQVSAARGEPVGPTAIEFLKAFQREAVIGGEVSRQDRATLQTAIERITQLVELQQAQQAQPPRPVNVNLQAPPARPKEAPLPAEFAP
jgi:hypothetical protein